MTRRPRRPGQAEQGGLERARIDEAAISSDQDILAASDVASLDDPPAEVEVEAQQTLALLDRVRQGLAEYD